MSVLHTISNGCLTVTAAEAGAELQSILGPDGTEYLWQGDSRYWSDRAINIFPYVARLTQGSYYLDGQLHRMAIHGIAPYRTFTAEEKSGTEMVFSLLSDERTLESYPRAFAFRIGYRLEADVLEVTYTVENRDEKPMYFGLGGHPGFNVPLAPGKKFEDYRLRFSEPRTPARVGFTEDCYLNGQDTPFPLEAERILPLDHSLFDQDAIVLTDMARQVTLETEGDSRSVTVTFPDMDYLGLWHWPKTDAPYVCIEPWSSLPSASGVITRLEAQKDLIYLAPGRTYRNRWTIQIR